ncbi:tensin-2 isoform X2 [Bombina bombina]|uniref:tensin-2 isoform X2 n=1 Tax=Bombina bombina TaxID=8345 RepID=UPI00235AFD25|nr:tensin-2 isoform X2 [Bombina bombina]
MKPRRTLQDMLKGLSRSFNCATPAGGERHVFHEKVLRKKRLCAACSEPVISQGSVCKVCKITSHKKCEGKVPAGCSSPPPADMRRRTAPGPSIQHMGSTKSLNLKQRSSLPRSFSLDQVIQRSYDLDLTYITERIISVFFPTNLEEQRYRSTVREVANMLRSKHEDKYLLFNLSKKRLDITRLNPKVQDFFWPDCHAPSLDIICSICKAMETWLNTDPQHVVVFHCKGNQGKTGVVIASFMHYSKVSASVDQALSTLAMRKFCEDKVSASLHPSQRRYINYFGGLLSGNIKISSDMLSLECVLLPVIPGLQAGEGFRPFLKIYQSMQLVYTSGIYLSLGDSSTQRRQICISLEPALLLKGDIMVKCYHKQCKPHEREVLFRLQFHTCTVHNTHLCFSKDQLDCACTDERFPDDAAVEFIFSSGHEKLKGLEMLKKDAGISVDYDITDPLVRFDSYENLNVNHEDSSEDFSHTRGPLDGSLYARVKKKSTPLTSSNGSPEQHGRLLSVSSDSGHSSAPTEKLEETPQKPLPTAAEQEDLERLLGGFGVAVKHEGESQYSQVLKLEELPQNGNQRQIMDGRPQNLQHHLHQDGTHQNTKTNMNGQAKPQCLPTWLLMHEDRTSQCLPLAATSWEGQRDTSCEAQWDGQREREAAILEEEIGQFGGLPVYAARKPMLSRHCSCRLGCAAPTVEGSYFRPEGMLETRGLSGPGAVLQATHFPGIYGEQDRRRLIRSLSEGPHHYPTQPQSPPKRGSLRENRQYVYQPNPPHEPVLPSQCLCPHCQSSACYSLPNIWTLEGNKMPPVQPFHHGELSMHYGQNILPSHDSRTPFKVPQAKMNYGYPISHGEEIVNFNPFTEGGYGHAYPQFLHPSYLPPMCPSNGYGSHTFSTCVPPYGPAGGHSPPPGAVSPIIPFSSAARRMSGDDVSVDSSGEHTPVQQHQQELSNSVTQEITQKSRETTPAISASASVQTNSIVHGQSPLHTSTPLNTQGHAHTQNPVHTNNPMQTKDLTYPQNYMHTSTPISTYGKTVQTHSTVHMQSSPVQTYGLAQTQSLPVQVHSPGYHDNPAVQGHSFRHTQSPPVQMNSTSNAETTAVPSYNIRYTKPCNLEHTENHVVLSYSPVHSQSQIVNSHSLGHTPSPLVQSHGLGHDHSPPAQSHNHLHSQRPPMQFCSQGLPTQGQIVGQTHSYPLQSYNHMTTQNPPTHGHSPGHTQSSPVQSYSPGHTQSPPGQSHSPMHTQNTPVQSHSPVHTQNTHVQSHSPVHTQNTHVQSHIPVHTQNTPVQSHSPVHTQNTPLQSHSPVHTQNTHVQSHSPVHTQNTYVQSHSPVHTQNMLVQSHNPGQQGTLVQSNRLGHKQIPFVQPHSSGHSVNPLVQSLSPQHTHASLPMLTNHVPQQQNTSVQLHSAINTQYPDAKNDSPTQKNSPTNTQCPAMQTNSQVHTKGSAIQTYSSENIPSTTVQGQHRILTREIPVQVHSVVPAHSSSVHPQNLAVQTGIPCHSQTLPEANSSQQISDKSQITVSNGAPCVHTQSQLVQTDCTVHTQSPPIQTHVSIQTQRQIHKSEQPNYNQGLSVQNQRTVHTQGLYVHTSDPAGTERSGFTLPQANVTTTASQEMSPHPVIPQTPSPPYATHVAQPQVAAPETNLFEASKVQTSSEQRNCNPNVQSPPSPNIPLVPINAMTLQKRNVTLSLPTMPINGIGSEAPGPTSPQRSPMGSQCDLLPPSPTPLFPISTAYYTGSPCPPNLQPPSLPEKTHTLSRGEKNRTLSHPNGHSESSQRTVGPTDGQQDTPLIGNFVQDSSKFWYKPNISREQAIVLLRGAEPGSFLIRDSNSFRGAYGLALKVSSPPPNIVTQACKGDPAEQLVRHFLIETGPKGVKIKGSPIEPYFGSLSALVSQHSVTPLSLPCRLRIPSKDLTEQSSAVVVPTNLSTAADLLRQGAACSVLYLGSVDTESLTGPQAISRASTAILTPPRSNATTVHFKVTDQGITLTDSQRKVFFRRHYTVSSVTFCSADPQDRRWTNPDNTTSKVFGFVARKTGTTAENVCHLFAELDPEQPASAIVNFITKVMLGTHRR